MKKSDLLAGLVRTYYRPQVMTAQVASCYTVRMQKVRQLVAQFKPASYKVDLDIDSKKHRFSGTVEIIGDLPHMTDGVILHAKDLIVNEAMIDDLPAEVLPGKDDELVLHAHRRLDEDDHVVSLSFKGKITESLHGLYICRYQLGDEKKELLMTQFESHFAREVFPCVDEPAAKATFELRITTDKNLEVVSNTPANKRTRKGDRQTTQFDATPRMSTYLLAFVIGELEFIQTKTKNGVVVGGYATKGQAKHMQFALDVAVQALDFYDAFFKIPYPLPKCDFVAVPDFSEAAMENWGCITGRESCLLVDEEATNVSAKQFVVIVVVHELAHQWFGNLVTMEWWNDLWLNEGFARFMEAYVADRLYPEWGIGADFLAKKTSLVQGLDALTETHPVQFVIHHPDEITAAFDSISYEKGAAAIYMLLNFVGDEAFRRGLHGYLKAHQYDNAVTEDLWDALSESSGKNVARFMENWIAQPGFPVIKLEQSGPKLHLQQHRFFGNPKERRTSPTIWEVPLLANSYEIPFELQDRSLVIDRPESDVPLKLNKDQIGYYYTLYDTALRKALNNAILSTAFSVKDRLGVLNETFELARAGYLETAEALKLIDSFSGEENVHVWDVLAIQLNAIHLLLETDQKALDTFNAYVVGFVKRQLETVTWQPVEGEEEDTRLKRKTLIELDCQANDPAAIMRARDIYESAEPSDIPADLRSIVYSTVVRTGTKKDFDDLFARYKKTEFAEERINIMMALCATTREEEIRRVLVYMRTRARTQDLMYWLTGLSVNPSARLMSWRWLKENWQWLVDTYAGGLHHTYLPRYMGRLFSTKAELNDYKKFFTPLREDPLLTRLIDQYIEMIDLRVQWRTRDYKSIVAFYSSNQ